MKKLILIAAAAMLYACPTFSQADSTQKNQPDTIHVGNFIIIKKNRSRQQNTDTTYNDDHSFNIHIGSGRSGRRYQDNISTNWLIFDLGLNNWNDRTNYGSGLADNYLQPRFGQTSFKKEDFNLRNIRSMNVNIWLFMQKLNVVKHVVNLKYGLGINMYNFFFEKELTTSYRKGPAYVTNDTVKFSKNKLATDYLTVPVMLNFNFTPKNDNSKSFGFSAGVSAGYLYSSRQKTRIRSRCTPAIVFRILARTAEAAWL